MSLKPFWLMNLYYEKMIFWNFYGLEIWGSCLDVHLCVSQPFCIENNRKTRKNGDFSTYQQEKDLHYSQNPILLTYYVISGIWWHFSLVFEILKISQEVSGGEGGLRQIGPFWAIIHVFWRILWSICTPITFFTLEMTFEKQIRTRALL